MKTHILLGILFTALLSTAIAAESDLRLYDIVPFNPGHEKQTAEAILRTHEISGLDTFLYSLSLDPHGKPATDYVESALASYRKLRKELGGKVHLGILLQSILGHWPRADREIESWQRTIDAAGKPGRFCVLDPRFRAYITETAKALAREKPCFILGDDDIRGFAPSGKAECFCPLHTAEANRRLGTSYTPEAYRAAVCAAKATDRVAKVCEELILEIPLTTMRLIRAAIDSVDPSIESGACMPYSARFVALDRVRAMCGSHPSVLRMANGLYRELNRSDFAQNTLETQGYLGFYQGKIDCLLDESDTFPHTLYARSGRTFGTKLALSFFHGLCGAKLWYVGMSKGTERVPEVYDRVFARELPRFRALYKAAAGSTPLGLRVPAFSPRIPHVLRASEASIFAEREWVSEVFGVYGIPFSADFSRAPGGICFLSGKDTIARLTDGELKEIFRGRVFIDGRAARALDERAFSAQMGCAPAKEEMIYNREVVTGTGNQPPIALNKSQPPLVNVAPTASVLSELRFAISPSDTQPAFVSAASVLFDNPLGGRSLTTSFSVPSGYNNQNLRRKEWLVDALYKLDPNFPVICANAEPNLTLARKTKDGHTMILTVNLGYDDLESVCYRSPADLSKAERLDSDGVWRPAGAMREGALWKISQHMPCFDFIVLRW